MITDNHALLIALDWGTSSCRAYLLGRDGAILAEREERCGTMAVSSQASAERISRPEAFERAFEHICSDWLRIEPALPVIACGMVGSKHGWAEANYRTVPMDLADTNFALTTVSTRFGGTVNIIPGLITGSALPSVMRGEETQILGALTVSPGDAPGDGGTALGDGGRTVTGDDGGNALGAVDGRSATGVDGRTATGAGQIVLLPGTHSKWVRAAGTTVTDFTTYMTGEVFALLSQDSTLSRLAIETGHSSWEAFDRGVDVSASPAGGGGFLSTAFSARSLALTGQLAPEEILDYLSGLLIGDEIAGANRTWLRDGERSVILSGGADLNERYRRALERFGIAVSRTTPRSAAAGMWLVAGTAGLLEVPDAGQTPQPSPAAGTYQGQSPVQGRLQTSLQPNGSPATDEGPNNDFLR